MTFDELERMARSIAPMLRRDDSQELLWIPLEVAGRDARLCVAIPGGVLDLRLFLYPPIASETAARPCTGDLARAICRLNESLLLPGFGFHEKSGSIYYRIAVPMAESGIEGPMLATLMETCAATAEDYVDALYGAATGSAEEETSTQAAPFDKYDRSAAYAVSGSSMPKPRVGSKP